MTNINLIKLQFQWGKDNMENPLDNMDVEDFDYLLESVDKLTNRIEELETQINFEKMARASMDSIERYTDGIKKENRRYREALEEIAKGEGDYYSNEDAQIALEALRGGD